MGAVDLAHAARAEPGDDPVGTQLGSYGLGHAQTMADEGRTWHTFHHPISQEAIRDMSETTTHLPDLPGIREAVPGLGTPIPAARRGATGPISRPT